jgi:DNA-binding transcriptional MerR regulator
MNSTNTTNHKNEITYSIGNLAKEFDITTRSIRFYEDQGLLKPTRNGQTRIYTQSERVRLKLILRGKRLGFSLAETGRIFELYDHDKTSATQLKTMMTIVAEKKEALHQQLDDIKIVLIELNNLETSCEETLTKIKLQTNNNSKVNT